MHDDQQRTSIIIIIITTPPATEDTAAAAAASEQHTASRQTDFYDRRNLSYYYCCWACSTYLLLVVVVCSSFFFVNDWFDCLFVTTSKCYFLFYIVRTTKPMYATTAVYVLCHLKEGSWDGDGGGGRYRCRPLRRMLILRWALVYYYHLFNYFCKACGRALRLDGWRKLLLLLFTTASELCVKWQICFIAMIQRKRHDEALYEYTFTHDEWARTTCIYMHPHGECNMCIMCCVWYAEAGSRKNPDCCWSPASSHHAAFRVISWNFAHIGY